MSCLVLVFPVCTLCLDNAECDGWIMSAVWRMVAFQNTSSTVSWHRGGDQPAALTYYKYVCVRDMKVVDIDTMCWDGLAADRTKWRSALKQHFKTGEGKGMTAAADKRARGVLLHPTRNHIIYALSATKTAIPTFVLLAISDAAPTQQEITKNKIKNIRMYHPWSYLTEGSQYSMSVLHYIIIAEQQRVHATVVLRWTKMAKQGNNAPETKSSGEVQMQSIEEEK